MAASEIGEANTPQARLEDVRTVEVPTAGAADTAEEAPSFEPVESDSSASDTTNSAAEDPGTSPTVASRPLWISPSENKWADILRADAPGLVNRHYHPHGVFAYTISGKWGYLEHEWIATAGDFVYETPGEGHTLVAYEHPEPMRVFFVVSGPLI